MGIFGRKKNKNIALAEAAAASANSRPNREWQPPPKEFVELGTIRYANLTPDGKHGDYKTALEIAAETGKPIFANFVEWSG
jgi:hypothetical protein